MYLYQKTNNCRQEVLFSFLLTMIRIYDLFRLNVRQNILLAAWEVLLLIENLLDFCRLPNYFPKIDSSPILFRKHFSRYNSAGNGRRKTAIRWHSPHEGHFHDTYQAATIVPWTGPVVIWVHWLCQSVSSQEPRGKSDSQWNAATWVYWSVKCVYSVLNPQFYFWSNPRVILGQSFYF